MVKSRTVFLFYGHFAFKGRIEITIAADLQQSIFGTQHKFCEMVRLPFNFIRKLPRTTEAFEYWT